MSMEKIDTRVLYRREGQVLADEAVINVKLVTNVPTPNVQKTDPQAQLLSNVAILTSGCSSAEGQERIKSRAAIMRARHRETRETRVARQGSHPVCRIK